MREKKKPNSKALAAVLSSLISQLLLLVSLLSPSSNPNPISLLGPFPLDSHHFSLPILLTHFISVSEISTTLARLSFSKKRKRAHHDSDDEDDPVQEEGYAAQSRRARPGFFVPHNLDSFKMMFRMNSSTFEWLCGLLEPLLECRDPVQSPLNLPVEARLGIGLFRLATGSDYRQIAGRFGVTESISRFCVKQLCRVLCTNYRFWVGFPNANELGSGSVQFQSLSGLPNCCGIIDCARFKIVGTGNSHPGEEDTIATQIVVDASSRILSIAAGFRGNKNKFMVLKSSSLYKDVENGLLMNSENVSLDNVDVPQYFVGDAGYPLLPWLIIPFVDPVEGSSEESFNNVLRIMRVSMLKTTASLRGWGVLSRPIDAEFKAAVANLGACSILHNMLLTREDFSAFCDEVSDDSLVGDQGFDYFLEDDMNEKGVAVRNALLKTVKRA
ncbi:OLC1v1000063C1 [Oldenlandia corymbosa var. corymbosa]|uniref:OLC1v1000063C1 n=1 Tax=Oldenlandia corymbosa var. corymbosa TaxID=529605 RepID=A0AAV1D5I6_OLDCO|nr:OLC1v1000063C1 [Oldenlandia corymbosa var. corymbosa]